jgi:type I restriction enzyme R subunit
MKLGESDWEQLALEVLAELGWTPLPGAAIAPGATAVVGPGSEPLSEPQPQRPGWDEVLIPSRLRAALRRLNPTVPREYLDQALAAIASPTSQDAITENKRIHDYLVGGFRGISYIDEAGREQNPTIHLFSKDPEDDEWLAVNQVTVVRGDVERRFDVVLYVNGMPLAVLELKRAGSASADLAAAQAQIATYVRELPMAFRFCATTVVSDGILARYGTPFTPFNHYAPWNVDEDGKPVDLAGHPLDPAIATDGITGAGGDAGVEVTAETGEAPDDVTRLELTLHGLFNQERFGQLVHDFVAFDENADGLTKRIAKPHQYFAVQKAVGTTVQAAQSNGKAGVVWHTQGSGKSMEMELYANRVLRHPLLRNPTIVVVTDRNELDGQLYQTFAQSQLLPEHPRQIRTRAQLREELSQRGSGGVYFTTLQKFGVSKAEKDAGAAHPLLSDRHNVVVIVDEAHRSHYDNLDGYAWHLKNALPHATLIAFTGTPISFVDRNTRDVFGDYIDVYDLTRAVEDGATVPVYFESRLVKVAFADDLDEEAIDAAADEATVGLDDTERDRIEKSVAVVNAIYGAPARLKALAADLVEHWESRRAAMFELLGTPERPSTPGKALVVGATRKICADLYTEIVTLRPDWHSDDLASGRVKVVYSGDAGDAPPVSDHVRRESENAVVKQRLKDLDDELELVIVKDMMLTGFDAPPLHTLYLDRPIKGALLMQTLARVNRTFRGKNAGLLVAYAPVAEKLKDALAEYTVTDREVRPVGRPVEAAEGAVRELLAQIAGVLEGFDWRARVASGLDDAGSRG